MNQVICGDCLEVMRDMEDDSVDLVFGSPPYEDCRTYGIDFKLKGQDWVDWMVEVYLESLRVCRGLVSYVVQGRTRKFRWSATPALLMADLHRRGVHLREGPYYHRVGIPGSGGPDWLRHDLEYIVSATKGGRLLWSDNTAMGHPPKWAPGGEMSHRVSDGSRINQWGHSLDSGATVVKDGGVVRSKGKRPSHTGGYDVPVKANPGTVIHRNVGGGLMGSKLAHENEAPLPESLAEFMIKSFCPPDGIVLDPFAGSGTVAAVAILTGRQSISVECRDSQIELINRRIDEAKDRLKEDENEGKS